MRAVAVTMAGLLGTAPGKGECVNFDDLVNGTQ